jgi:putative ABC transport system permease protein
MSRPVALAIVRAAARVVSFTFAPQVRRMTDPTFIEWADHRWQHERGAGASASRATGRALRVLFADALATAPSTWMLFAAAEEPRDDHQAPRRSWWRRLGDGSGGDLKLAVRSVRQRPGFALLVVATLGLGLGASAAAFDALDRTVLRPLPFADSDRLALIAMHETRRGYFMSPSAPSVARWRQAATTLDGVEVARGSTAVRTGDGPAERVAVLGISAGLPTLLQVQPKLGRMLGIADSRPDAPPAVMIAESYWRQRYGASPDAIGRVVHLSGTATTIAGVWPEGARVLASQEPPLFIRVFKPDEELPRGSYSNIIVKLRPGLTADAVETELASLQPVAAEGDAAHDAGLRPTVQLPSHLLGDAYITGIWLVFVGAAALLIASIANASHLIAVRASARRFELGIRLAVGGSLARLLRLFLLEGLVLGSAGIAVALAIATLFENLMTSFEPRLFAPVLGAGLAGRALFFACATALAAVIACSIAPLLVARATDLREALSQSGRTTGRTSRWRLASIATQAAIAAMLVVGAALMARSYRTLARVDPGIDAAHVGSVSASWPAARYSSVEARQAYVARLRDTLKAIPGVTVVTTSGMPILSTSVSEGVPYLDGEPEPADQARSEHGSDAVYEDFFRVVGTRLVAGRYFEPLERDVAVVTENFARQRSESVVGKMLVWRTGKPPVQIVGVIADLSTFGVAARQTPVTILRPTPGAWDSPTFVRFLYRAEGDPASLSSVIRQRFAEIDPDVPASAMESGREVLSRQTRQHRFVAVLLAALAGLGVMLAMAGMYGAVALDVSRRTREVGIRLALGASRRQVVQTLARRGLVPVLAGAATGLALAQLLTPQLETLLFGVQARDLLSVASAAAVVVFAALVACVLPARRAGRVDPVTTLRA